VLRSIPFAVAVRVVAKLLDLVGAGGNHMASGPLKR
jgi:hypothetical protein